MRRQVIIETSDGTLAVGKIVPPVGDKTHVVELHRKVSGSDGRANFEVMFMCLTAEQWRELKDAFFDLD